METQISETHVAEITTSEAATGGTTMMVLVTTRKMAVISLITMIESRKRKNGIMSHLQPKIKINRSRRILNQSRTTARILLQKKRKLIMRQDRHTKKTTEEVAKISIDTTMSKVRGMKQTIPRKMVPLAITRRTKTKARLLLSTELLPRKIPILLRQLRRLAKKPALQSLL
jgi:hypothetical protein